MIDITNLLFAVQHHTELRNELISGLPYSIEEIEPQEGFLQIDSLQHNDYMHSLIEEMNLCKAGKPLARTYEVLCHKLLENTFSEDLALWKEQQIFSPLCTDYNLSVGNQVEVTVYGKVLDENYTKLLFEHSEFDIQTVFLIDQVQKHHTITKDQAKYLRKLHIIEGRMPNIYLSADIAKSLEKKEQYVKNKGFNDEYYRNLIVKYLEEYKSGTRENFRILLMDKLPDNLDEKQKENKIRNLLYSLKRKGIVQCLNKNSINSTWVLVDNGI